MRSLEADQSPGFAPRALKQATPLGAPARHEAEEQKPVGRQAGDAKGRRDGRWAGDGYDRMPALRGRRDQPGAGVAYARRSSVRDKGHIAGIKRFEHLFQATLSAVCVVAQHAGPGADPVEQLPADPRVLGRDELHFAQNAHCPRGQVLEVSDRCGDYVQRAHLRSRCLTCDTCEL